MLDEKEKEMNVDKDNSDFPSSSSLISLSSDSFNTNTDIEQGIQYFSHQKKEMELTRFNVYICLLFFSCNMCIISYFLLFFYWKPFTYIIHFSLFYVDIWYLLITINTITFCICLGLCYLVIKDEHIYMEQHWQWFQQKKGI